MTVLAWAGTAYSQAVVTIAPTLTLRPAVVLSLSTEAGKGYQMQASSDLENWSDIGEPVFSTGDPVMQPKVAEGRQYFRLKELPQPLPGFAPATPAGLSLQLNEGSRVIRNSFAADGSGTWQTGTIHKSCTWTWQRTGFSESKSELKLSDGSREVVQFSYCSPQCGRFTRLTYMGERLLEGDAGSFGPGPAAHAAGSPLVPSAVTGRSLALCEMPGGSGLSLGAHGKGTRQLDGTSLPFQGSWLVTGSTTARLSANFGPTHGEDYQFTFTGPQTGRFIRHTYTGGVYRDTDSGNFCLGN